MKTLLYKQLRLVCQPMTLVFCLFGVMLLIPAYPYTVMWFYVMLGLFFSFLNGREQKDVYYSALLPIRKRDTVKANCLFVGLIELLALVIAVPFALLRAKLGIGDNPVGLNANVTLFACGLMLFAVFNAVYGAGVTSKLFQNVREKLSLCYYAFSSIDTLKGIMAVLSGIEVDKYDEALSEILAQLDAVRAGSISEAELAAARRSVANDLRTGADSPYYLADFYLRETVQGTDATPDDIAALAENVTAEDVAAIARGVELDAVYFLRGEEAETE